MIPDRQRSSRDIRRSLGETRRHLEADLDELEQRVEAGFSPRQLLSRHPAIVTVAGAVVGIFVVRNPKLVVGALSRVAQLGAPLLLKAFLNRNGSDSDEDAKEEER